MFMVSFRLSKKRIALGAIAIAVVAGIGITGVRFLTGRSAVVSASPVSESQSERIKPQKVKAKNNEERVAFAESFGWEIDPNPVEVLEVIIPEEFDDVYMEYNSIQKQQGFDLEKYAGKRVKRYTYKITNYPGVDEEVHFNLLAKDDKIVGGDVSSLNMGGFMHGFEMAS